MAVGTENNPCELDLCFGRPLKEIFKITLGGTVSQSACQGVPKQSKAKQSKAKQSKAKDKMISNPDR
jgi:hypothetical protein